VTVNLRRIPQALGRSFWPFVKRHPFFALLVVPFLGFVIAVNLLVPSETPQQRQVAAAQQSAESEQLTAQRRERDEHLRVACRVKRACEQWATVRQECAVAGNFDNCVNIKMEDKTAVLMDYCTNDGHMGDRSEEPSALDCLFH
jgi:hypothetical protein